MTYVFVIYLWFLWKAKVENRASYYKWVLNTFRLFQNSPKLNLGQYEFQKMGRIGSTEMNLIWENFGITKMCSGLIDTTGSSKKAYYVKLNRTKIQCFWSLGFIPTHWGQILISKYHLIRTTISKMMLSLYNWGKS